ncbi:MAG: YfhO family protein [Candidatus Curtissbacteria bacterium]
MKKSSSNLELARSKPSYNLLALFATVALVLAFFTPGAISGKFPIPADALLNLYHPQRDISLDGFAPGRFPAKNTLITDPILQTYPWRYTAVNNMKLGNLPLWNPYSFSGQPLAANIQSAPYQITNFLFFILPFKITWVIQIILPEVLLAAFTFLYLRFGLNLSLSASVFGGFVLPFTGFFVSWSTWGTVVTTAMWLPLILLSLERISKIAWFWSLVLILSFSQTIFSGHWQTALYVFAASFLYAIFKIIKSKSKVQAGLILFAAAASILIASIQILPSLEFIEFSARGTDQTYTPQRKDWFLPPQNLIQLIAPDFFGNPTTGNYWGVWNYGEFVSFVGLVPLFLAIFAITKKKKEAYFFACLAVVSLGLALANPVSKIPYLLNLPLLSSMQPSRIIFLLDFSIAILAAFGLDFLINEKKLKKIIFPICLLLLITLALMVVTLLAKNLFPKIVGLDAASISARNMVVPTVMSVLLLSIVLVKKLTNKKLYLIIIIFILSAADLFRFSYKFTPFSKLSWIFPETQTLKFLQGQEKPFRIMTTDRRILHPNSQAAYALESVDGYDPLYLSDYSKYISTLQSQSPNTKPSSFNRIITPQKYDSKLSDLLNVKYVVTLDNLENPNFVKVFEEGETKTYLNKKALPRAFFVNSVVNQSDEVTELTTLLDNSFDLTKTATSRNFSFPDQIINGNAQVVSYRDSSIDIKTTADKTAPLILTNIYYPGWRATVDGKEVEIKKADYIFQSILVPAGEHSINFSYRPQSFYNGLYLTLAGLTASAAGTIFLYSLAKRRRL